MKNSIETIRAGLTAQLAELDRDLGSAHQRIEELRSARRQVAAAVKALGGGGTDEPARPAPKQAQVRRAIDQLLAENGGAVAAADLESLVAEKLAGEQGCSAMGLALRVRELLAAGWYVHEGGEVRRPSANAPSTTPGRPAGPNDGRGAAL